MQKYPTYGEKQYKTDKKHDLDSGIHGIELINSEGGATTIENEQNRVRY